MTGSSVRFIKHMNTVEVEAFLAEEKPLFLPIGTLEAHGRHLPVGTDTLCAEKFAEELSLKLAGAVAPAIEYGITNVLAQTSPASFFSEELFEAFVEKIIQTFYLQGFKTIIIINGHGGNRDALKRIMRQQSRLQPIALSVINWWLIAEKYVKESFSSDAGGHAAVEETAAAMHFFPHMVTPENYDPQTDDYAADNGVWLYPPPGEVILHRTGEGQPDFDRGKSAALIKLTIEDIEQKLAKWLVSFKRIRGGLRP